MTGLKAVQTFQCPGCILGDFPTCYEKPFDNHACAAHCPATIIPNIGTIFLNMPKGFNRLGPVKETKIGIFDTYIDGWDYGTFNVPVWKYYDQDKGVTIIRGFSPRINYPWIHIFLENCLDKFSCIEITSKIIKSMN